MAGPAGALLAIGSKVAAEAVGEGIEATGRVLAGTAIGAGHAIGGAAQGIGTAIAGTAKGIGEAVGGALQGAMTPPDTVINNVGIVGNMGKQRVRGASTVLTIKSPTKPSISESLPTEKLLGIAINYLSSIENTLKAQLSFDVQESKRLNAINRENSIEEVGKSGLANDNFEQIKGKEKGKSSSLKTALLLGGLAAGGALLYNKLDTDELKHAKKVIDEFVSRIGQVWNTLSDIVGKISYWYNKIMPIDFGVREATMAVISPTNFAAKIAWNMGKAYFEQDSSQSDSSKVNGNTVTSTLPSQNSYAQTLNQTSVSNLNNTSKEGKMISYLMQNANLTKEQAAGVIGNLKVESQLNPGADNPNDVGKPSYGLAQWRDDRKTELINFMKSNGKHINDLYGQLDFLIYELKTKPYLGYKKLLGTKTPHEAARVFMDNFERPSKDPNVNHISRRIAAASEYAGISAPAGAASAGVEAVASAGSSAISSIKDSFSNNDATEEKKEKISVSGTIKTLWDKLANLVAFDTEYKPFVKSNRNDSAEIDKKSTEATVNEIAGIQKSLQQLNATNDNRFEKALRIATGGSVDLINPNYNMSSDNVISKYLEFFELLK